MTIRLILLFSIFPYLVSAQCDFFGIITPTVAEVCYGSDVTLNFSLAPGQADSDENELALIAWQYSYTPDNAGSWSAVPGAGTDKELVIASLTRTTFYRARYNYEACPAQYSGYITVTVYNPTVGGDLQGSAGVCESNNSGTITLVGNTGEPVQWYRRDETDLDWMPLAETGTSISYGNLLLSTRYRVEVKNGECPSAFSSEATIAVHPNPVPDFTASLTCDGNITRFTNQSVVSEGHITDYAWSFGDGSQSTLFSPQKQYYNPDVYNVTLSVVSNMNCTATVTNSVTVHPNPISDFTATDVCWGANTRFTNSSRVRSGEGMSYIWSFGDDTQSLFPSPDYQYTNPGTYRVKLVAVTAIGLCRDSVERDITVFFPPDVSAGNDVTVSAGHGTRLEATGGESYTWSPHEGLSNYMLPNPFANPPASILYTVTATDAKGCTNTAQVNVFVNNDFRIHPYNVITPDGNGENDTWIIEHIEHYPHAHVRIVNRWGEEVFYSQNYTNADGWNGFNSNGDILPEGTYYYIITIDDDNKVYKGAITLLRK